MSESSNIRRRHVLVIDDDDSLRSVLEAELELAGYQVTATSRATEALQTLREKVVDIIVLDLMLPDIDGWEFRVQQRKDPSIAHVPVIVISGDPTSKAAAVDAAVFLQKPFLASALCTEIECVIGIVERERARALKTSHTERMASLGMLAAGVGHEINNPLTYLLGNLERISRHLQQEDVTTSMLPELRRSVTEAMHGAERIRRIVRDLRVFTRSDHGYRGPVDLRDALELAINICSSEVRQRGQLVKRIGAAPAVKGDEARLSQVFVNLLVNAAHSLDENDVDRNRIEVSLGTDERGFALVEVRDTGIGISPRDISRVFDPFFTTRDSMGGGLGLAIVYDTVRQAQGQVHVESEVGKGSLFRVTLPPWSGTHGTAN